METGVWGERGRPARWGGSRIWLTWRPCEAQFCIFCVVFFIMFLGVHLCDFWVPSEGKGSPKEAPGSPFWTAQVNKTCPTPWI